MTSTEIFDHAFKLREFFEIFSCIKRIKEAETIGAIDGEVRRLMIDLNTSQQWDIIEEYRDKALLVVSAILTNYKKEFEEKNIEIIYDL